MNRVNATTNVSGHVGQSDASISAERGDIFRWLQIWPGENGHIRFELKAANGDRIGYLAILSQDANSQGQQEGHEVNPPLCPGDERWVWFQSNWPNSTWKMSRSTGDVWTPPQGTTAQFTSLVTRQSLSEDPVLRSMPLPWTPRRVYKLSFNASGSDPVAWLMVDLSSQGDALRLHWFVASNHSPPELVVDSQTPLFAVPVSVSDPPDVVYVLDQATHAPTCSPSEE